MFEREGRKSNVDGENLLGEKWESTHGGQIVRKRFKNGYNLEKVRLAGKAWATLFSEDLL